MKLPVTIDPRFHEAVIFDLDAVVAQNASNDAAVALVRRLGDAGVATALYSSSRNCEQELAAGGLGDLFEVWVDGAQLGLPGKPDPALLVEATRRLGARVERSVVVDDDEAGVSAGRSGGFSLVIGLDRAGHGERLLECGADVVVADLAEVAVRTGDKPMSEIPNALQNYRQFADAVGSRQPMVFLDYDGTLSNIVPDPDTAVPVEGATEALAQAAAACAVAILSGRDLADVRARVGVPGIWYAGSHGFELIAPDGSFRQNDEAAAAVPVLERAAEFLRETLSNIAGVRVEHKRFAVAIHYRDVAPEHLGDAVAAAHRLGRRENLRVTGGRKVIELRPNVDWDKGTTLAWISGQVPGDVFPIYIGDDLTDEDAFDAVRTGGIGVLVRHTEDGDRPSSATFTLENPDEVTEFLRRGAEWLARGRQCAEPT